MNSADTSDRLWCTEALAESIPLGEFDWPRLSSLCPALLRLPLLSSHFIISSVFSLAPFHLLFAILGTAHSVTMVPVLHKPRPPLSVAPFSNRLLPHFLSATLFPTASNQFRQHSSEA
ncbi:unnamed protein product [Protopolystoma xenopodis]|uniref:Uncharacterized protein n=1 Tax=Protopolystoma xenopodis TaxID=117903 RepID=A0A448WML8_9PLAT|nr:unnamed protein product [Protopolystoma xenopodis]